MWVREIASSVPPSLSSRTINLNIFHSLTSHHTIWQEPAQSPGEASAETATTCRIHHPRPSQRPPRLSAGQRPQDGSSFFYGSGR